MNGKQILSKAYSGSQDPGTSEWMYCVLGGRGACIDTALVVYV